FVQQFFGYIETYALLFPLTLFYLWAGLRVLEQRLSLMIPAALLGILIPIHFVSITLLPSLALLGYQIPGNMRHKITRTALGLIISALVALVVLTITGYEPYTTTANRTPFLPIFNAANSGYTLLSFTHGLNLLNSYFLSAPLFFLTLTSGRFLSLQARDLFLGSCALFSGLFTLIANPEIGAFRDWDILSFPALPLTLWSVLILTERPNLRSVVIIFCGAAFLHTGLWIGINAHNNRAETRYEKVLTTSTLSKDAQSYGWETLGTHFRQQQKYDRAIEAYEQAIDARPENARHWNNLGGILYNVAQFELAAKILQQALVLNPNLALAHVNLADVYYAQRNFQNAKKHYQKALILGLTNTVSNHVQKQLEHIP
ncbi:MAG: tetratricopeptide repeat protein, partial [Candidatus Latescibacteria bacterium]|nr:tetratricopeptide repeat protein [Candidatus Latescibacterota bacterium]